MKKTLALVRLLVVTTALVAPAAVRAQNAPTAGSGQAAPTTPEPEEQIPEVSLPGSEIVVTGRPNTNIQRSAPQVVSVLSSADIARTGAGDIAGSLSRVTGLSVVGNGYVYVRGLGDRYSLAMLNGLPLPSPEPLKRVVPLDIFPTNVIASSLVQKSYSPNFPGEFGGGVVNLTTKIAPREGFFTVGTGIGLDTETTGKLGYTYFGSPTDWTGFDNGQRDMPSALVNFLGSGKRIADLPLADRQGIAQQLSISRLNVVQRNQHIPPNWSATASAGKTFDLGGARLGVIATAGYTNKWRTRDNLQQSTQTADLSVLNTDYNRVVTDDRVVVNGLLGVGLEFDKNKIRWTNLYIRDTLKQTRLANGFNFSSGSLHSIIQDSAWYERQLINTQLVGEFRFGAIDIDVRGGYANSQREAPWETTFQYSEVPAGPAKGLFVNVLDNQTGDASVVFSDLDENLWAGSVDATYHVTPKFAVIAGFAYMKTDRTSSRREFSFVGPRAMADGTPAFGTLDNSGAPAFLRPDYVLGSAVIRYYGVDLQEPTETSAAFGAGLKTKAGYVEAKWQVSTDFDIDAGVRYETGREYVAPLEVFNVPVNFNSSNLIDRSYWLPAATVTWTVGPEMQLRAAASKTIARPQFRELLFQRYYDPDTNRTYAGNPNLVDSQLYNAELRYEWYFAREQRFSIAGFYKRIDNPIEQYLYFDGNNFYSSFANAPKANLWGGEIEAKKYFELGGKGLFADRRLVTIANYTYTKSKVKSSSSDRTIDNTGASRPATDIFLDGRSLTGQSNHLINLELGFEQKDSLSQQTLIFSYASKRLTNRGPLPTPDFFEYPGIRLDFVARQAIQLAGLDLEAKLEIRNITGTGTQEYQEAGNNRVYLNRYKVGTTGNISITANF